MRLKIITMAVVICFAAVSFAEPPMGRQVETTTVKEEPKSICPKTAISDQNFCFRCHTQPSFKIKEASPLEIYDPPFKSEVIIRDGEMVGYHLCDAVQPGFVRDAFEYFAQHIEINRVIIEVHNPGGQAFDAWRIVGIIQQWGDRFEIETHLMGMAFSAGFIIFEAGEKRLVSPMAEFMWHEVKSWVFVDIKSPSKLEDEADTYRHLQNTANAWLASISNLTKDEIDTRIRKKEFWFNGKQAVEMGFADGFLEKN